jgi:hypothetical protein
MAARQEHLAGEGESANPSATARLCVVCQEEEGLRVRQPVTKSWQESFWGNSSTHNVNRNQ